MIPGIIIVVLALVYMTGFGQSATTSNSNVSGSAYTPAASGPVVKFVPPVDNTNINTGSSSPSIDGAATTVVPAPTPVVPTPIAIPAPVGLVNLQKSVRVYSDLNFKGREAFLRADTGVTIPLGEYQPGTYVSQWKSMRVDPGVKIIFTLQDMGPGIRINLRKSFAVGRSDVPDIETWMHGQARLAGLNNWGYGSLDLNKPPLKGYGQLNMKVLTDDAWNTEIKSEYNNCMTYVAKMKATDPSKYSDADCASLTSDIFGKTYT